MKELLFEILTPDGYVKNGFDKKKLKSIMKNTMVVNYDKNKHNLNHIDKTKNSKKISFYEYGKKYSFASSTTMKDKIYFILDMDDNCRVSNLADSTIKFLKENMKRTDYLTFVLNNPKNIKLSSEDYAILKELNYDLL